MSRVERAYAELRQAIERGEYRAGTALPTQPALARMIGVSTVTLRYALERLAEEGFVEARQGQGTFVRSQRAAAGPVLVADDDETVRALLLDALIELGYQAEVVGSGEQAIERVRQRHFSHVLLDVRMGGIGGVAAADQIARLDPRAVVVYVTAYPTDIFLEEGARPWPALVLRKPFELGELERVLQLKVR